MNTELIAGTSPAESDEELFTVDGDAVAAYGSARKVEKIPPARPSNADECGDQGGMPLISLGPGGDYVRNFPPPPNRDW